MRGFSPNNAVYVVLDECRAQEGPHGPHRKGAAPPLLRDPLCLASLSLLQAGTDNSLTLVMGMSRGTQAESVLLATLEFGWGKEFGGFFYFLDIGTSLTTTILLDARAREGDTGGRRAFGRR